MSADSAASLRPVLTVGASGRTGSTAIMELLASSPTVALRREYPYESRLLLHLTRQALTWRRQPTAGDVNRPLEAEQMWSPRVVERSRRAAKRLFGARRRAQTSGGKGLDRASREALAAASADVLWLELLDAGWSVLAQRLLDAGFGERGVARLYAEKWPAGMLDELDPIPAGFRIIHRLRDPRDVWASITAFDEKRGYFGFGRRRGEREADYLSRFIDLQRQYLAEIDRWDPVVHHVIRYEELVTHPGQIADELGAWLGVELDAAVALEGSSPHRRHHATSESPAGSIGRWQRDLDRRTVEVFARELGPLMASAGYR